MDFARYHPFVYYATKYIFSPDQASLNRHCYSASIYFVTEGRGIFRSQGCEFEALPGMMVYMEAGRCHDWISSRHDPMTHVCCYFDWHYVDRTETFGDASAPICYDASQLQPELVGPSFPYPLAEIADAGASLRGWVELLQKSYTGNAHTTERTFLRGMAVQSYFLQFIEQFLNFSLQENQIPDPRITKLLARIEDDLLNGSRIQPEVYAESLGLSRGYFFELFKRTTGTTPIQYMNQFLVHRAKDDLRSSNLSIMQIAEKYHFQSLHYFSRLFKQYAGKSPQSYRLENS
ncbi:helix-turn-helix transcriptional regulator [Paenibacillus rhizovicinus]|uniref:Helix-turn-helix transcriptional regulator n=1 Tax=Paenibacillus rhizovicinus TaxID=2704463 RepID=A0A6C0P3K5_9BACL|nr:AraC family transcriptional regulator [Paenibacillus rhizovicinus]QHW31252.1 helix-turn-helix transcriptional regulator [Paenibacillus rhizovicinus]